MSEANGVHLIPASLVTLKTKAGEEFTVPLVGTIRRVNRILKRHADAGSQNFEHLDDVIALIREATGVALDEDDADYLVDYLSKTYLELKNARSPAPE